MFQLGTSRLCYPHAPFHGWILVPWSVAADAPGRRSPSGESAIIHSPGRGIHEPLFGNGPGAASDTIGR